MLVTNPLNVTYLTGFSGEASYLIVTAAQLLLVSDGRFTDQLREECPDLETVIRPPTTTLADATAETLQKLSCGAVGFETGHLTVAEFQTLSDRAKTIAWKPGANRIEQLRQIKDAWEIGQIRLAIHVAEKAFGIFRALVRPDDSEKELVDAMESHVRRAGGKCTAFPTIVAVGERAALPHAPPTSRRLRGEKLVLVDWGANGPFYKSDLTRILVPHNNAAAGEDQKLREVYEVVLHAQTRAIATLGPGVKAGDVDAAARQVIIDAGYGQHFTHSIGHGFGLQIHEAPLMKPGSELVLQAGMVVTVEPGIYLPGWGGIRIEDDILITENGHEVLTTLAKDFPSTLIDF